MIRILHVIPRLFAGGEQTLIMEWYRKIDRNLIQFDFVVCHKEKGIFEDEVLRLGGNIYHSPRFNGRNLFSYISWWKQFFKEHKEYKIIHGHLRSTAAIYLYIAKKNGLYTIAHSHSTTNGHNVLALCKDLFQIPVKHIADYMFACSAQAAKYLFGKSVFKMPNYSLLANSIDCMKFQFDEGVRNQIRNELNIGDKFVIGQVGRFVKLKNHEFSVGLFEEFHKSVPNSCLLFVGDGELKEPIKKMCKEKGLINDVIFIGVTENVCNYYQAMDYYVMPSLNEGLGIVAVEAQASGLPVICNSDLPMEIKCTDNCVYYPLDRMDLWIKEMLRHKEETKDRAGYSQVVAKTNYNIDQSVQFLTEFYKKAYQSRS